MGKKSKNNKSKPTAAKVIDNTATASLSTINDNTKNSDITKLEAQQSLSAGTETNGISDVVNDVSNIKTTTNISKDDAIMEAINNNVPLSSENKSDEVVTEEINIEDTLTTDKNEIESKNVSEDKLLSELEQIESLCMNCHENGMTRFMIHKIPYFRQLIIASFNCDHCGERNNEVTFGGEIQLQGCRYELLVTCAEDLDRQLIKSDSATIRIVEIDFEIPPATQKGEISTIEGFITVAHKNLNLYQTERMQQDPIVGMRVQEILDVLDAMSTGTYHPFTIIVDDPSGNSFIQNPFVPKKDPNLKIGFYPRTAEQDASLGIQPTKGVYKDDKDSNYKALVTGPGFGVGMSAGALLPATTTTAAATATTSVTAAASTAVVQNDGLGTSVYETDTEVKLGRSEIVVIPSVCPNCGAPGM